MALYGRRPVPGEKGIAGALDQRNVLNRTLRAQVSAVNPENGYVLITYENMPSGGKYATVPPLWMSFPDSVINSGPAWGRYMPQQSDLVKVAFGYDDKPHIIGYDIVAGKSDVGDGESGWPQLNDQYKAGRNSSDAERAKFAQFTPLNPGEYDFMSSGGSYIYGNNRGKLYLAGGSVSISLIKNDLRISQRAQLWSHIADDCEFRFGQVRRVDSVDQLDKSIGTGREKELSFVLKNTTTPGVSLDLSTLKIGNVIDTNGIAEQTPKARNDLRWSQKLFNDLGIMSSHVAIDKLGNWEVSAPTAPTGVNFDFSAGDWLTTFKNATHTNTIKTAIVSPNINLGASTATEQLILGTTYRIKESIQHTQMNAALATITAGLTTASGGAGVALGGLAAAGVGLSAAAVAHVIPIAGPIIGAPGVAAAGVGVTTASAGMGTITAGLATIITGVGQLISAITAFEASSVQYLSQVTKTI